ncbi:MAG: FlgD immunoglobulin-like domain containing protein [Candidatus Latescibacterota bacterium]
MLLGAGVLAGGSAGAQVQEWVAATVADFDGATVNGVRVDPDSMVVLAAVAADTNLAFGRPAVDDFGRSVPLTDGGVAIGASEWLSGTPNVFGRWFTVDLGVDRAITRVRVLPGASALAQPEYYIRGYRLESASQGIPDLWRVLAEEPANLRLTVDTALDSTWAVTDGQGRPQARVGRWVRLTLIRQDRSNWVALGEIQVYGSGHTAQGWLEAAFAAPSPVNVGRVLWEEESPPGTQVGMRVVGQAGDLETQESGALFGGPEPAQQVRWRAELGTSAPFRTPVLRRVAIQYDPVLVARGVLVRVEPDTVAKATPQEVTCAAQILVGAGDHGVDFLRLDGIALQVSRVRVAGAELKGGRDYAWSALAEEDATLLELAPPAHLEFSATVEIVGSGLFLQDRTQVVLAVGSRRQQERDGYLNWQNSREAEAGSALVRALGPPPGLVGEVRVEPSPFSPFGGEPAEFRFVVGNVQEESQVVVDLYTLAGDRVRRLEQSGRARAYLFAWDGRDEDGRTVDPGLYLYEVRVKAGDSAGGRHGALVVAY